MGHKPQTQKTENKKASANVPGGSTFSYLFGEKFSLEVSSEGRKQKVSVRAPSGVLAMDVFSLAESSKRAAFVGALPSEISESEKTDIVRELLSIADQISTNPANELEPVHTAFKILDDGRIIEQIRGGFAVYAPNSGWFGVEPEVADGNFIYRPIEDELFVKDGGIYLADALEEYGTEAELDAEIENFVSSYLDLKPLHLKLTAKYIRFTYIFDKVLELSYLNATGDPGSGKSRFGLTVCIASHRGLALISPSAASLFRIVDKFKPTLFLDEFNTDANSDDAAAIIQILNAGFQKTAQIPRQVSTPDGKFKTEMFDGFCPKIIGSLKQSASNAFNSRCIEIQMERTQRNDIPLRLSNRLLNDAQKIRNKLTLWRLRNFNLDFEARLDRAEAELRAAEIIPRSIQINIPLFALITDNELKRDFIALLKGRDEFLNEEKRHSFDGELVRAIHTLLFDVDDNSRDIWKIAPPKDGELCEELRTVKICSMLNDQRKQSDELNIRYVGKKIHSLGLLTKQIKRRHSEYFNMSAIFFDAHRLQVIFRNYGLTVPDDFSLDSLDQRDNLNNLNSLPCSKENKSEAVSDASLEQLKPIDFSNKAECSNESKENLQKPANCKDCGLQLQLSEKGDLWFCGLGCGSHKVLND